jgi:heptosyltransferase III
VQSGGKILVIRGGAIGDFILTLPAIAALRRQFPRAHLEVLGYPHIVQLAVAGGLVDRVHSIEAGPLAGFFARNGNLDPTLVTYFAQFNVIISYLFDPDDIFKTNVARATKAQFIAGPHRPSETEKIHATQVFLKPLERLAIFDADPLPRLHIGQPALSPREQHGSRRLALHPGSGSEKKNWPERYLVELIQRILDKSDCNLLLVGGEAEGERLERLSGAVPAHAGRIHVARSLDLAELARRLQHCSGMVGHDSGISHLAAALGLPTVVLWGDTVEEVWRPPHSHVTLLKSLTGLSGITVEQVSEHLRTMRLY